MTPKCEHCGCTEDRACEGGCWWLPAFAKVGRWVCSNCGTEVKPPPRTPRNLGFAVFSTLHQAIRAIQTGDAGGLLGNERRAP